MKKIYSFVLLSILLSSCYTNSRIDYIGSTSQPTNNVDVFVDEKAIPRAFTIVGKAFINPSPYSLRKEKIMTKAVQKAKEKGADAIFYQETFVPTTPGTNLTTHSLTDSLGKGTITVSNTSVNQSYGYLRTEILFLKYNK